MIASFELELFGGAAERRLRRRRGDIEELPWQSLDPREFQPNYVERARAAWTESAYAEYCTAAAFAEIAGALLAARAPIDLVAMAADFVSDEMLHVELNARMAMALGGGAPFMVDYAALVDCPDDALGPIARASERIVRTCCVGEALSVPILATTAREAGHPLTRSVLARIARDEPPHARFGEHYLEWAADRIDDDERARLAKAATNALRSYAPEWSRPPEAIDDAARAEVNALGWVDAATWGAIAREAVRDRVTAPLARFGVNLDPAEIAAMLAA